MYQQGKLHVHKYISLYLGLVHWTVLRGIQKVDVTYRIDFGFITKDGTWSESPRFLFGHRKASCYFKVTIVVIGQNEKKKKKVKAATITISRHRNPLEKAANYISFKWLAGDGGDVWQRNSPHVTEKVELHVFHHWRLMFGEWAVTWSELTVEVVLLVGAAN